MPRGPQSSPTQDLEARFSVFLNPIRDLTKNWEVDIAKYLEEYLEELAEVQITFDGGETMMNFAEAAMLIQGSATVYSKKVEFLWQMVLQMLDLLSSRRTSDFGDVAIGGKEGGGGKGNLDETREFISVDNIGEGRNIDMKDDDDDEADDENRRKAFKFLPATPLHLVEKEAEKSQHRINLLLKNMEVFGGKDDFRINRSYMTSMGVLCLDLPAELCKDTAQLVLNAFQDEQREDEVAVDDAPPSPMESAEAGTEAPEENDDGGAELGDGAADLDVEPLLEPIPEDPPPQPMELENQEKTDKSKEGKENNIDIIDLPNGRYGLRKRGAEKEAIKLKLSDPWKPLDPHAESPSKRPVRAGRLRKPMPCTCHKTERTSRSRRKKKDTENEDKKDEKTLPPVEAYITKDLSKLIEGKNKQVPPELREEANKEHNKRLELTKQKKMKDLLNNGSVLNAEEAAKKLLEDNNLQQKLDDDLEDLPDADGAADFDAGDDLPQPPLLFPNPHDGTQNLDNNYGDKKSSDSQYDEPGSEYEELVQKWVSEYITNAQDHINSSGLTKRVNKWRENVLPKLEEEERRQAFDIHSYGSQVLSFFPENGRKQTVPFQAVAQDHEAPEVSRLFLSCLMLANTYNIQLQNSIPGEFAMDCLELTLLSRVRHHEELEEYAAPSMGSPTKRKGRTKGSKHKEIVNDVPVMNSDESPLICADITHFTIADNIQVDNCNNTKKGMVKKKR